MTRIHLFHDWKLIEEFNISLPCIQGDEYWADKSDYKIRIGYTHNDFVKRFNIKLLRCWKCDKQKYVIIDREGKNHSKDVQGWVLKEYLLTKAGKKDE